MKSKETAGKKKEKVKKKKEKKSKKVKKQQAPCLGSFQILLKNTISSSSRTPKTQTTSTPEPARE